MKEEYIRKIQLTGGSTYIVSLPKGWIEKYEINKNETIRINLLEDGRLVLSPLNQNSKRERKATIFIEEKCNPREILRLIISHYILGYDTILVQSKDDVIDVKCRNYIKENVRMKLFGAEFMDEAAEFIKIQVLTPYVTLPIRNIVKRMSDLALNMHRDIIKALDIKDTSLLKDIINRDDDVDRLYFLSIRQLTTALYSPAISSDIGIDNLHECLEYRLAFRHLERIADHATIIANMLLKALDGLDIEITKLITNMSSLVCSELRIAVEALLNKDIEKAEKSISFRKKFRDMEEIAINKISELEKGLIVAATRMTIESYRRVSEYSAGIAEIAINLNVVKPF